MLSRSEPQTHTPQGVRALVEGIVMASMASSEPTANTPYRRTSSIAFRFCFWLGPSEAAVFGSGQQPAASVAAFGRRRRRHRPAAAAATTRRLDAGLPAHPCQQTDTLRSVVEAPWQLHDQSYHLNRCMIALSPLLNLINPGFLFYF